MGTTCCRRNNLGPETELYSFITYNNHLAERKLVSIDQAFMQELVEKYSQSLTDIIKIQSWYRGCISRRNYKIKPLSSETIINYISSSLKSPQPAAHEIEKKLGPYKVSWSLEEAKNMNLKLKRATIEKGNMIYHGYWNIITNEKQGYGQELFPNGTKYEGFWNKGEFDGKGRFIYENGDYFFGDWKKGKTNGIGTFISSEGTKYNGGWKDNLHEGYGKL